MPFVSESQRRYCWVKYNEDIRNGKKPSWDCDKWEKETKKSKKSKKRSPTLSKGSVGNRKDSVLSKMSKKSRESMRRVVSKNRKIHTGVRGGKYVVVKGKKIYV